MSELEMPAVGPPKNPSPKHLDIPRQFETPDTTDELVEKLQRFHAENLQRVTAYNNIITSLGYAGIFAMWQFIRAEIQPRDNALVVCLFGVSLIAFILWILITSTYQQLSAVRVTKALADPSTSPLQKLHFLQESERKAVVLQARLLLTWKPLFAIAVVSGLGAGVSILILSFSILLGSPVSILGA
jgi:hypothetical protein